MARVLGVPRPVPDERQRVLRLEHWRWHGAENVLVRGCPVCVAHDERYPGARRWVEQSPSNERLRQI